MRMGAGWLALAWLAGAMVSGCQDYLSGMARLAGGSDGGLARRAWDAWSDVSEAEDPPAVGGRERFGGPSTDACRPPRAPTARQPPRALIVTNAELAPSFRRYADLHTVTGILTEVVTVEDICAAAPCVRGDPLNDTAKAIKDYLRGRPGLRHVLLGGGVTVVPSRQVHDSFVNPFVPTATFTATFPTDYYYSDFSEWDTDENGVYAEKGVDAPVLLPSVTVARIPVQTAAEADAYLAKVVQHLTAFDSAAASRALVISNLAFRLAGAGIDAAVYLESSGRTLSLLAGGVEVSKLYATSTVDPNAGLYSPDHEELAFKAGQALVVHAGHASYDSLTQEIDGSEAFTGARALALTNATHPIFLSCGCRAGDITTPGNAGEDLVLAPSGGAVAYLGNVPLGLGIAGGMQLIDELLRYVQAAPSPLLADAWRAAHLNLPEADLFTVPGLGVPVPVIDSSSYQWTQKAAVLLGDSLIPVWTAGRPPAPALRVTRGLVCNRGLALDLELERPVTGTLRFLADGNLHRFELLGEASATAVVEGNPHRLVVGLESPDSLYGYWEFAL